MAKKLTPKKAQEILRDGIVHGKPLTGKQKRFFGWMSQKHYHMKPYLEGGGGIIADDGTGIVYPQDGVVAHAGPGYQGLGYSNSGYNYNSAWGGRFESGGYIPEAQAGIELGAIPTQETYMGRPVGNKLTPPPSGIKIPTTDVEKYAARKAKETPAQILPSNKPRSASAQAWVENAYPMTALGYRMKGQQIPNNFEKGETNPYDEALAVINPFNWIHSASKVPENLQQEEYVDAGLNAMQVIPLFEGVGTIGKNVLADINYSRKAGLLSSKDLKEASRYVLQSMPTEKSLPRLSPEDLKSFRQVQEIGRLKATGSRTAEQMKYALENNLPEEHFQKVFEKSKKEAKELLDNGFGQPVSGELRTSRDFLNLIREPLNNQIPQTRSRVLLPQERISRSLIQTLADDISRYAEQKQPPSKLVRNKVKELLNKYAQNYPYYSGEVLEKVPSLSLTSEGSLKNVSRQVNFAPEGVKSGEVFTGSTNTSHNSYLPQLKQVFKYSEGAPQFLGYKPMNPLGFLSNFEYPNKDIAKYLNTEIDQQIKRGILPKDIQRPFYYEKTNDVVLPHYGVKQYKQGGVAEQKQMGGSIGGGSLPGATGMMYARTGPTYRDKKEAGGMLYYEQGLDWQPRTISKAGSTVPVSSRGLYDHPNQVVDVPTPDGSITMADIDYPVYGVDNTGMEQMMMPGGEYQFDGDMVRETPMMKAGGEMIKRADGSYSRRGLWDNIRANKGSGKKPTKEMLKQERKIKRSMEEGGVVAQAGTEVTPQAPPQPSKKSQLDLVLESPSKFDNGKTFHDIVKEVATESKVDPRLLWSSSFVEGMNLAALKPNQVSNAYLAEHERSSKILDYPVDGFYNYGLDNFGDTYPELVKRGYLPKDFDYYSYKTTNEQNRPIKTAAFRSNRDAVMAKAAYLKYEADRVKHYAAKQKLELTPDEQAFFTMAAYNGGLGSAQAMLEDLKKSGLAPSAFIKQGKTSKGQVYKNVKPRYDMMFKVANMFEAGGEVKTIQDMGQLKKLDQLTNFTNYNYYE